MNKVLVTGGTGLVGAHLLYYLAKQGISLVAIKRKNSNTKNVKKIFNYYSSESKSIHEKNNKIKPQAHSDYINHLLELYGFYVDVMVEAKAKELSILPFLN